MDNNIESTWNKTMRDSEKLGFREGIIEGKSANYQENFDKGYLDGFHNGFALGKFKGILRANNFNINDPSLEKTRRGNCAVCEGVNTTDLRELRQTQKERSDVLMEKLCNAHPSVKK